GCGKKRRAILVVRELRISAQFDERSHERGIGGAGGIQKWRRTAATDAAEPSPWLLQSCVHVGAATDQLAGEVEAPQTSRTNRRRVAVGAVAAVWLANPGECVQRC